LATPIASTSGDGVPAHAHWIPTDTTEVPGKWIPRRQNWRDYLVTRDVPGITPELGSVIDDLQHVVLTSDLRTFALESLPMGIWDQRCQATPEAQATPTVSEARSNPGAPLTRWLSGDVFQSEGSPTATDHVHYQSRGEGVFRAICQNCHGPQIDSKSALAATIQELTGGTTRVANFVAGLFGPPTAPGAYAHAEFLLGDGLPSEDWQVRYVLFMGLGGTGANIPIEALNLVATSPFYGQAVTVPGANSPNMLGSAQQLCFFVLDDTRSLGATGPEFNKNTETNFVPQTGHYELWESLCAFGNAPLVHVFTLQQKSAPVFSGGVYRARDDAGNWIYPSSAVVGNQRGGADTGVQATNLWPWCVMRPGPNDDASGLTAWAKDWEAANDLTDAQIPYCPAALFATTSGYPVYQLALDSSTRSANPNVPFSNADFTQHWLHQGAFNTGISAFYFMRGFAEHDVTPDPTFDFCTQ
jgi:mono/diheme cytochrome c family protein